MINYGSCSGSCFGKVLVPIPVPVPDPDLLSTVFQQQKICTKSYLFNARIGIVSHKVGNLTFDFSLFTGMHYISGSGSAKQKVAVPPVPVPQH